MIVVAALGAWLFPAQTSGTLLENVALLAALAPPFLLPWSVFRGRAGAWLLIAWTSLATVVVTARVGYLLVWFYPRREIGSYLLVATPLLLLALPLWLATWAAWSRRACTGRRV